MNRWTVLLIVGVIGFVSIYALNNYVEQLKEIREQQEQQRRSDQAAIQRKELNETVNAKFEENFQRQNVLGNVTVAPVLKLEKDIKQLLENRTIRFDKIENMLNASIQNQRTIIHNQYVYSLPENLNASGVSNKTR